MHPRSLHVFFHYNSQATDQFERDKYVWQNKKGEKGKGAHKKESYAYSLFKIVFWKESL